MSASNPTAAPARRSSTLRSLFTLPRAAGWRDHVIGLSLAVAYVVWLLATARSLGFPRDESFYFQAGTTYARWFERLLNEPAPPCSGGRSTRRGPTTTSTRRS